MRHCIQHFSGGIGLVLAMMEGSAHTHELISIEIITVNKLNIVFRKPNEYFWAPFQCFALNSYRREKAFWHILRRLHSLQSVVVALDFVGKRLPGNFTADRNSNDFAARSHGKNFFG